MGERSKRTIRPQISRLFNDYVFWRDTLSTLLGGILVLIVAFIWAVLMGYLSNPGFWEPVVSLIQAISIPTVIGYLILASVIFAIEYRPQRRAAKKRPEQGRRSAKTKNSKGN